MYQKLAPIISNQEVMPGVYLMWIKSTEIASSAKPGQFVMLSCANGNRHLLRRPISVHRVNSSSFAILFAVVGAGTEWLAQRQVGEKIDTLGPLGNGFSLDPEAANILLLAGGMGIAPLCFLATDAIDNGHKVKLLAGARTASQICPERLIPAGCHTLISTDDGTAGKKGLVTDLIPEHIDWANQVFVCGPLPMSKALAKDYPSIFQSKPVQVSLEVRMGCGLGFCYTCTIKTRQGLKKVCQDGPVFDMNDLVFD